jgi:hypothetical protein
MLDCQECKCNKTKHTCELKWKKDCCPKEIVLKDIDGKSGLLKQGEPLNLDFETGTIEHLKVSDANPEDFVTVSIKSPPKDSKGNSQGIPKNSQYALYFGDPGCETYYNAELDGNCKPVEGGVPSTVEISVTSPEFDIPPSPTKPSILMSLYVWIDVEDYIEGIDNKYQPDQFRVRILKGGTDPETLMSSASFKLNTKKDPKDPLAGTEFWYFIFDLSKYYGKKVSVDLDFNTGSDKNNFYRGVYVDNMKIWIDCEKGTANACTKGSACTADSDPCTDDQCALFFSSTNGYCGEHPFIFCCLYPVCDPSWTQGEIDTACNDDNDCTKEKCETGTDGCYKCVNEKIENCCIPKELFMENFDSGSMGQITQESSISKIKWQVSQKDSNNVLYFGDPISSTYGSACGPNGYNKGVATLPGMKIPDQGFTFMSFELYLNTEWDAFNETYTYCNPFEADIFETWVTYLDNGITKTDTVWSSHWTQGTTKKAFIPVGIDLTKYKGKDINVKFTFNSQDCTKNNYEGAYIDNIKIATDCVEKKCMGSYDCGADGICKEATCDSSNKCSVNTIGGEKCCVSSLQCVDSDNCTMDICFANECMFEPISTKECCKELDIMKVDFESGMPSDFLISESPSSVIWQLNAPPSACSAWGAQSLYFGNKTDYADGENQVSGWVKTAGLTLPPIIPPATNPIFVSFNLYLDVEVTYNKDILKVTATNPDQELVIFHKDQSNPVYQSCSEITGDLSNFAGKITYLKFEFDSMDGTNNTGKGIWIDNIRIYKSCPK